MVAASFHSLGDFAMLTFETLAAFTLASLVIELTPGPNMTYLALLAARHGKRPGYAAVVGVAVGLGVLGLLASLGLATLPQSSPPIYGVLRWGGVAYLLYLAWEAWNEDLSEDTTADDGRYFTRGLITNLLNPKAALFYVAVMPGFLPAGDTDWRSTAVLAALYVTVATVVHGGIVSLAGALRPLFANRSLIAAVGKLFALALVAVAAWVAYATRAPF